MAAPSPAALNGLDARGAVRFVILLGLVSLFADMTYESARSLAGPFLALLGASATAVGMAAGFGEFIGYALRFVSGQLADRTHRYWLLTILGYFINLLAVPALTFAGNWQIAVGLLLLERTGKALRNPPRDAMLSFAGKKMGQGWGFALHEAMDQVGATVGPLLMMLALALRQDYRQAFAWLAIPAAVALILLCLAARQYPHPARLESKTPHFGIEGYPPTFWLYLAAMGMLAAGFADYPLIAFHLGKTSAFPAQWIPFLYAMAMAIDALSALLFGYWYDRLGMKVLAGGILAALLFSPLVFLGNPTAAVIGILLWGVSLGVQESVMKALVAAMSPESRRATAYGVFHLSFGLFWFLGSAVMGMMYDLSLALLVAFSMVCQVASLLLFFLLHSRTRYGLPAE